MDHSKFIAWLSIGVTAKLIASLWLTRGFPATRQLASILIAKLITESFRISIIAKQEKVKTK